MRKQVLFIQGGGEDGYEADAKLVAFLQNALGLDFELIYPRMQTDETAPAFGWLQQIENEIGQLNDDSILVAHSLGASLLLKYLSETSASKKTTRNFLLATPFWAGDEDWVQSLKLQDDFAKRIVLPGRFYFYHCQDDEEVPATHLATYRQKLPGATFREFENGGHQFVNCLDAIAKDIRTQ
ncbi:MAG: hypothetical protein EOO39_27570 [Cytophagaceae bacterium]|nr:MAG: hypothetical protein EOO39_27570 [Cytophagaceae bacterium]